VALIVVAVANEGVSWQNCPNCGRPVAVIRRGADVVEFDCPGGCLLHTEQVPGLSASRDHACTLARVAPLTAIFEEAILDTAATYGFTDPREAAALVAAAWKDILRDEGHSPSFIVLATAAVREIGDRLHRRPTAGPHTEN
jgi:hypothetical protein